MLCDEADHVEWLFLRGFRLVSGFSTIVFGPHFRPHAVVICPDDGADNISLAIAILLLVIVT